MMMDVSRDDVKLKNYVFELNGFTSVPHDLGHERFFYS